MGERLSDKLSECDRNSEMILEVLYAKEVRTGITTSRVLLELEIFNSGFSDIRRIFIKNIYSYLSVRDPYDKK